MVEKRKLTDEEVAFALNVKKSYDTSYLNADSLTSVLVDMHKDAFHATHGFDLGEWKSGFISEENNNKIQCALQKFLEQANQINENLVKQHKREDAINAITHLYLDISRLQPFTYGNDLIIRKFITTIAPEIDINLDFSRLERNGTTFWNNQHLHNSTESTQKFTEIFNGIADEQKDKEYNERRQTLAQRVKTQQRGNATEFPEWPSSKIDVGDVGYLAKSEFVDTHIGEPIKRATSFVTLEGGIIAREKIEEKLQKHLESDGHPADFTVSRDMYDGWIDGFSETDEIDNIPINHKKVPLFSVDVDHFTGLTLKELKAVDSFILNYNLGAHHKTSLLDIPLILEVQSENGHIIPEDILPLLQRANERIKYTQVFAQEAVNKIFEGKQAVEDKKFFMSMGGTGAGKSDLFKMATASCHNNLVTASLDEARTLSRVYDLYSNLDHQNDDYQSIFRTPNIIRNLVVKKATEEGYHLYWDGSGSPYRGKNSIVINDVKKGDYKTTILAAEAPLYLAKGREDESDTAVVRWTLRKDSGGHMVPVPVAIDKHIQFPNSYQHAGEDPQVDSLVLMDNSGKPGEGYILEESFWIDQSQVAELWKKAENETDLLTYIKDNYLLPEQNSFSPNDESLEKNMAFRITCEKNGQYRLVVTVDKNKSLYWIQKGSLNPAATNYADLALNTHEYHAPALDYPGVIRSGHFDSRTLAFKNEIRQAAPVQR